MGQNVTLLATLHMLSCSSVNNGTRPIIHKFSPQSLIAGVFNCFEVAGSHLLPHAAPLNGGLHVEAIPKIVIVECYFVEW